MQIVGKGRREEYACGLPFLFIALCAFALVGASFVEAAAPPTGVAPVMQPTGGLAIDGNLMPGTPTEGVGDWVAGANGGGVLNDSGQPLNPATTFHFIDPYGSTSDQVFGSGGGLKWVEDPRNWTWTLSGASGKTDINNVLMHITSSLDGHMWLVIAADRASNKGESYIDFEFLQNELRLVDNGGTKGFSSAGPHGGRTLNDLVLSLAFTSGGGVADFYAYRWEQSGAGYTYVDRTTSLPEGRVFLAASPAGTPVPFGAFGQTIYGANTFAEAAIDLTALMSSFDKCLSIGVKTIMVKTKTSPSDSANIVDFINPIQHSMRIGPSANAGLDQARCSEGSSTRFQVLGEASHGMDPITSTTWSVVSGTATIGSPDSLSTSVQVSSPSATLRLTVVEGTCVVSDDIILTVTPLPVTSISGDAVVCPKSSTTYTAPEGMKGYTWTITGNGSISGRTDGQQVTVVAGADCAKPFTLTLAIDNGTCPNSGALEVLVNDTAAPELNVPAELVLECANPENPSRIAAWLASASAQDACGAPTIRHSYHPNSFSNGPGNTGVQTVEFTATDLCQNASSKTARIVIVDKTPPSIVCPGDLILECADAQQAASIADWLARVTGSDACGGVQFANDYAADKFSDLAGGTGRQTVTFTATDESGNTASCSASIIIQDTTPPSISCPGNLTLECADLRQEANIAEWLARATGRDTCGTVQLINTYAPGKFSDGPGGTGRQTVTFTATDESGNKATCSADIIVQDTTPPSIRCPADLIVECAEAQQAANVAAWIASVSASDTCGEVNLADNYAPDNFSDGPGGTGEQRVTFTATDESGNEASCTATIIIRDTTAPSVNCPGDLILECADPQNDSKIAAWLASIAGNDVCGTVRFTHDFAPGRFSDGCGNSGEQTVRFTATDTSGNQASCTARIVIKDTTPPTINCPVDLVLECADPQQSSKVNAWLASVRAADTCGTASVRNEYSLSNFSDGCGRTGVQTVNFTATDGCGNTANCAAKIIIQDTTAPTISCPTLRVQCVGDVPARYNSLAAFQAAGGRASDSCSATLAFGFISETALQGSCPATMTRVYQVTDECGNSTQGTQTIIVDDTIPPVVTCPPALTLEVGSSLDPVDTGSATATDNCSTDLAVTPTDVIVPSTYLLKFYASDPETNSAPYLPTYIKLAPRNLSCPALSDSSGRALDPLRHAVAFDPVSGKLDALTSLGGEPMVLGQIVPFQTVIEVSGSRGDERGTIEFIANWSTHTTSNDRFGYDKAYKVYCAFVDPVDPGSVDPHRNAKVNSYESYIVNEGSINEQIEGKFRISGLDSGDRVVVEIWLVLASARPDNVGGTIAAELVSAQKMTPTPEPISVGTQTVSIGNLSKIQPLPPLGQEPPAQPPLPPQPPEGEIPGTIVTVIDRTWAAIDGCANRGSCVQRITLVDNTPPVMTVPNDVVLEYRADLDTSPEATGWPVVNDAGTQADASYTDYVQTACGPTFTISREWTAMDEFGHPVAGFQFISVMDTTPPVLTLPRAATLTYPADITVAAVGSATASDTGGPVTMSHRDVVSVSGTSKIVTRIWTATDACGNVATGEQGITVLDAALGGPAITVAPNHRVSGRGNNAVLSVTATGSGSLSYQWSFNGQPIAGATESSYRLTSLRFSDAGVYSVVVSDADGFVAQSSAVVNVLPKLSARVERQRMTVVWEEDFLLQTASSLSGPYRDVPVSGNPYSVDTTEPHRFFRLRPKDFSLTVTYPELGSPIPLVEVAGSPGICFKLQASSNRVDWVDLTTGTAPMTYLDTGSLVTGSRLYRVVPIDTNVQTPSGTAQRLDEILQ